jgi:hypothetical protein
VRLSLDHLKNFCLGVEISWYYGWETPEGDFDCWLCRVLKVYISRLVIELVSNNQQLIPLG